MNDGAEDIISPAPQALKTQAVAAAPPPPPADLSGDVERTIGRERLDLVRCARVFGDFYRCNWWAPPAGTLRGAATEWLTASTQRVRKSRFLNVTLSEGKLVIKEVTLGRG